MKYLSIFLATLFISSLSHAYVLGSTDPGKWGSPIIGTGATITWSLMPTGTSCKTECTNDGSTGSFTALDDFMPTGYKSELVRAFDAWSNVANLTFIEVTDDGSEFDTLSSSTGDIRIGGHSFDGSGGTLAHGYFPPQNRLSAAGDIHFDMDDTWSIGFGNPGVDIFQVFVHELGHALGLAHTTDPNSLMYSLYSESFSGPQADDIAGMQYLYGAAVSQPPVNPVPSPGSMLLLLSGMISLRVIKSKAKAS